MTAQGAGSGFAPDVRRDAGAHDAPMGPRYWTVTIGTETLTVVAATREAAMRIAARRLAARSR